MHPIISLLTGLFFGIGLAYSEMTNPAVVLGFLDITGHWNPSLLLVMGAAVAIGMLGYVIRHRRVKPWLADKWFIPSKNNIDGDLIKGAVIFGIGWGLAGYCPGPGLTALVNNPSEGVLFVIALLSGSALFQWQNKLKTS